MILGPDPIDDGDHFDIRDRDDIGRGAYNLAISLVDARILVQGVAGPESPHTPELRKSGRNGSWDLPQVGSQGRMEISQELDQAQCDEEDEGGSPGHRSKQIPMSGRRSENVCFGLHGKETTRCIASRSGLFLDADSEQTRTIYVCSASCTVCSKWGFPCDHGFHTSGSVKGWVDRANVFDGDTHKYM